MATTAPVTPLEASRRIFARIIVGIDGSPQALEAARQGALLGGLDSRVTLFAAWDIAPRIIGGTGTEIPYYYDEEVQRTAAEEGLAAARNHMAPYAAATSLLVRGAPVAELLDEIERDEHTLVAVGGCGTGRLRGIVEGSTATEIVHRAPCTVLVARPADERFPRCVVVGVDGSVGSAAAYVAAHSLAGRFGAELRAVVAHGGKGVDDRLVAAITGGDHVDRRETPCEALTAAMEGADLVVVGSRGLHGVRALGSISERIAHSAPCSTLVVRKPPWQRVAGELGAPRARGGGEERP